MSVSAVIVTHNSAGVIRTCWRSVRSLLPGAEVIVVDNASTDETPQLSETLDGVTVLANLANVGFGRACNQGVDAASGSHALILNPDVELNWVDEDALSAETAKQPFGLVAPILDHGAGRGSHDEHWAHDLVRHVVGPLRPRELPTAPRLPMRKRTWWPAGALLLVDRLEFERLGGFDPRFFLYYEDRDLARRYRAGGLPVRPSRSLSAVHRGGESSSGESAAQAVRQGWSYLSWIQYIYTWDGRDTAVRAARSARKLRADVDRTLAVAERVAPMSDRAARKRRELAAMEAFVSWQCGFGDGTAGEDFCPEARAIVAAV